MKALLKDKLERGISLLKREIPKIVREEVLIRLRASAAVRCRKATRVRSIPLHLHGADVIHFATQIDSRNGVKASKRESRLKLPSRTMLTT